MTKQLQPKLKLFSAFHKPYIVPNADYVQPIHAGKALGNIDLGIPGDDTGDNISKLNPAFSEVTMMYWIWKNADRAAFDYWGVTHYRRYFCFDPSILKWKQKEKYILPNQQHLLDKILTPKLYNHMLSNLKKNDLILIRPHIEDKNFTLEQQYKHAHVPEDWNIMISIIKEKYPDYVSSLHFFDQPKASFYNMMIAPWSLWDKYLPFLFDMLFEISKRVADHGSTYQNRVPAFMSERLMNLFVYHHKLKAAYYPLAFFDEQ
jgi:hypothetical protein